MLPKIEHLPFMFPLGFLEDDNYVYHTSEDALKWYRERWSSHPHLATIHLDIDNEEPDTSEYEFDDSTRIYSDISHVPLLLLAREVLASNQSSNSEIKIFCSTSGEKMLASLEELAYLQEIYGVGMEGIGDIGQYRTIAEKRRWWQSWCSDYTGKELLRRDIYHEGSGWEEHPVDSKINLDWLLSHCTYDPSAVLTAMRGAGCNEFDSNLMLT